MPNQHYNRHVIYVDSMATNEQLRSVLSDFVKYFGPKLVDAKRGFEANMIIDRAGRHYGFGYIWMDDERLANVMLGLNPDATERSNYIDDPNWVAPEQNSDDVEEDDGLSWADVMEKVDAKICPKIKMVLPSLYKFPSIEPTEEQRGSDEEIASITFKFKPAHVDEVDPKYSTNVLCSRDVPRWVTEEQLKEKFKRYVSDPKTQFKRKFKGVLQTHTYPHVTINEKRVAFITFDHRTYDAQFARLMARKLHIQNGDNEVMLIFDRSYK